MLSYTGEVTDLESAVLQRIAEETGSSAHDGFVDFEHLLLAGDTHVGVLSRVEKP